MRHLLSRWLCIQKYRTQSKPEVPHAW